MDSLDPRVIRNQIDKVLSAHSGEAHELIPILQGIQGSVGYIPAEAIRATARFLKLPESTVYGVVTFYAQFHLTRQGKHRIRVCQGTACHVRGGKRIMETVRKQLGIRPGETTPDYRFTLERVACLGSCALAPVMVTDDRVYGSMTPSKAKQVLDELCGGAAAEIAAAPEHSKSVSG